MQIYTLYFIWKLLYMFRVVLPPIIRSAYNCIYSIWYLSDPYCYPPLQLHTHTHTHTHTHIYIEYVYIYIYIYICERISTDLNLVTWQSTVHEPPEDGLKNGTETCRGKFLSVLMWILVLFKAYIVCVCAWVREIILGYIRDARIHERHI